MPTSSLKYQLWLVLLLQAAVAVQVTSVWLKSASQSDRLQLFHALCSTVASAAVCTIVLCALRRPRLRIVQVPSKPLPGGRAYHELN